MMQKIIRSRYGWVLFLFGLLLLNILMSGLTWRVDLTAEKRYTLSNATEQLVKNIPEPLEVEICLEGELPAGFRRLALRTGEMLESFRSLSGNNVRYRYVKPGADLPDSLKAVLIDSLRQLGINAVNVKAQTKEGEEQQLVYPGVVIRYKDRITAVDFLQGQNFEGGLQSLQQAEALLEYKLASGIRKITQDTIPLIGYLSGNGEPLDYRVYDLIEKTLRPSYTFRILPLDQVPVIPEQFKALLIVKPQQRFSDAEKLKLDQYVMHGGKLIWALDNLYASLDSLQRSEGSFIAFDMGLNVEDLLFRYGVRINQDLVQDIQCDRIPSVIGSMGGKPQIQLLPWPYFPLLRNVGGHPVSRHLDYIVSEFPQSIDTVNAEGIRKTILLSTSPESRILNTPAKVEWASVRNEEDLRTFNRGSVPVSVLLEGRFRSLYSNRVSKAMADTLALAGQPFRGITESDNKMVVISDGDIFLNAVSQSEGPLSMGMNGYTKQQYANREFLLNVLEFMLDDSGIMEARSKDIALRLLDAEAVGDDRLFWQLSALLLPILLVIVLTAIYQYLRKRRYAQRVQF
jgi:ABC-2 type transport system permease protein